MNKLYKWRKKSILIACSTFISFNAFSQIKLNDAKVATFANEVFLNCSEYTTPQHLEFYKNEIHKIVIYKTNDLKDNNIQVIDLNTLFLKNKCNPNLQYDNAQTFVPENFNPLKYFFPKKAVPTYYKIKDSDYIIQVNPL